MTWSYAHLIQNSFVSQMSHQVSVMLEGFYISHLWFIGLGWTISISPKEQGLKLGENILCNIQRKKCISNFLKVAWNHISSGIGFIQDNSPEAF